MSLITPLHREVTMSKARAQIVAPRDSGAAIAERGQPEKPARAVQPIERVELPPQNLSA
jgi:hypothetical protein